MGRREAGAAACRETERRACGKGTWGWGLGTCAGPGAKISQTIGGVTPTQAAPTLVQPPLQQAGPFPAPEGQVEGTGLECSNNHHWPPGWILLSSPGTKTEGTTHETSAGPDEAPRRNQE